MAKKPAAKRPPKDPTRRTSRGLLAVGANLPSIAAPALRKRGFAEARLITDWPSIVGESMARETLPQKLAFPRGSRTDAILHLRVASGFALELQHSAPQVIERINGFFGFRAVADLRYVQGPIPLPKRPRRVSPPRLPDAEETRLQETLGDIEDDGLKTALEKLGRAVVTGRGNDKVTGRR